MAAVFQSLRSSSMPKRLLRYALSRLELLDADALDMDNLDFALGRNTVFEFRDVGIKLKKLQRVLNLPPSFELLKAKVLLLRVTIPVDFYTSPITVEVDGVDVRLKVASEHTPAKDQAPPPPKDGISDVVPNTADLAESFLQNQPEAEKRKLEEAIAAETQDLGASVSVSDDGSEDETSFGTGQPLSLPTFLGDFLQGIVDRTQVRIRTVTFQLDVETPLETPQESTIDTVTFQVVLDDINVEGITAQETDEDGAPTIVHREGKRHISLSNIRAHLVSEANVFSAFARSPPVTPAGVSQSPAESHHSSFHGDPGSFSTSNQHGDDYLSGSTGFHPDDYPLRDSELALNIPYDFSGGSDEENVEGTSPSTPRASAFGDLAGQDPGVPGSQSATFYGAPPPWASVHREARSTAELGNLRAYGLDSPELPQTLEMANASSSSDSSSQGDEDLTRSHLFSHEEAESMYASAFSELPTRPSRTMPGAWENYSSPDRSPENPVLDDDNVRELEASQQLQQQQPTEVAHLLLHEDIKLPAESDHDHYMNTIQEYGGNPECVEAHNEHEEHQDLEDVGAGDNGEENDNAQPSQTAEDVPPTPPQEQTPRGPTRLVKELVTLKNISIYAPLHHKHIHVHPGSPPEGRNRHMGSSVSPNLPGAFSVHSSHESVHESFVSSGEPADHHPKAAADNSLEIVLSPVDVRFDASLGFLLATVVSKLLDALNREPRPSKPSPESASGQQHTTGSGSTIPELKLKVEKVSLHFLHHLMGVADTPERTLNSRAFDLDQVTLLRSDIEDLSVTTENVESTSVTLITLGKFRFGYADTDILSFDRVLRLNASIRDVFPPKGADVSVKLTRSGDVTRTEVTTLPLVAEIDLQKLDETFSWFGGLSSFLNMGSSVSSIASPIIPSPKMPKAVGVRFETPISPDDRSASSENKIDTRVGGLYLRLIGTQCDVSAETSAVKLVKRNEGIGIGINTINLSGPYLKNSHAPPSFRIDIEGTRLEYLLYPQESDLDRLLKLITPSNVQPDLRDDEIMVDTLLRQRRKGPVLRLTLDSVRTGVGEIQQLACLPTLSEEIAKLATVAKYLPEDDRPGLLTLGRIKKFTVSANLAGKIGLLDATLKDCEVAHIPMPSLVAIGVDSLTLSRNQREELVSSPKSPATAQDLAIVARMIGDEMEPVFKLRLQGLAFEYRVPTLLDLLGLSDDATPQDFEAELAASVANLGDHAHAAIMRQQTESPVLSKSKGKQPASKPFVVDVAMRDCLIGLNPLGLQSKLNVVLTDARLRATLPREERTSADLELRKAAVLLIDDASLLDEPAPPVARPRSGSVTSRQVSDLCSKGYVEICFISSATAAITVSMPEGGEKQVEVSFRDDLLVMETCADSTQTLISLANALKPPTPPRKEIKYRTNVMPVEDLLASISAEAFGNPEGEYDFDNDFAIAQELQGNLDDEASDLGQLDIHQGYYDEPDVAEKLFDVTSSSVISLPTSETLDDGPQPSIQGSAEIETGPGELMIQDDWFVSDAPTTGAAQIWNSTRNTYDRAPAELVRQSPLKVTVRDVHVIWNLFDGYDWVRTRDVITKAVEEVEAKATEERRARTDRPDMYDEEFDEENDVIGDFLFNSIYIGIPTTRDARDLTRAINQDLNDNATESESVATSAFTSTTARPGGHRPHKKLKLSRSKRHKITFELQGIDVDMIVFPPGSGETESSIDIRVKNLDVLDSVPTSTWKKFATYDRDAGERELGSSMVHIEMLNVRPLPDLAASEIVMRATVLPLRLHVDQDALDFITRFFEFKDDNAVVHQSASDVPFLQRAEVNDIPVKLDFKPKRVDYAGLRSGRTTEFMNFVILDEARLVLRHTIIYGVSGFERLGQTLNDIWMPDVKKNQLPSVLAGLAPVRSIVNVGSGFRNLVEIPLKEYKKDGRIVRSISKGASAFVRTTGTEIIKLGAKMAVGTQYALQGAEGLLVPKPAPGPREQDEGDPEETNKISLYADQPMGVIQGLRGGYASLSRDLNLARDAIIAVPGAVMDSQNAQGAARALLKKTPTIVFRPAIGATKALGQTLLGATNTLDPQNKRRIDDKYKKG